MRAPWPRSAARCPTSPASTSSATSAGASSMSARPLDPQARRLALLQDAVAEQPRPRRDGRPVAHVECVVVASEAEALLAEQSFIKQYRPRFNIRLRDDKSYPFIAISLDEDYPRVYFTRERHRSRPRLLRPLLQRQARARDARGAREGVHVPLLHRARAGPAQRQPVPGLLHQALRGPLRRLHLPREVPREHRRSSTSCPAASSRSSASWRRACARPRRPRSSSRPRSSATACAASIRCSSAAASPAARSARSTRSPSRSTGARPTRRCSRSATACSTDRQSFYLDNETERERRRGRRGVHAPVLRRPPVDPGTDRRPARARAGASGARRSARQSPRGSRRDPRRPSAGRSGAFSSSPIATRCSRSIRSACAPSAAARAASRRSRACSRR